MLYPHSIDVMLGMCDPSFGVLRRVILILVVLIVPQLRAHSNCIASGAHHTMTPRSIHKNMHVFVRVVLMVVGSHAKIETGQMHGWRRF